MIILVGAILGFLSVGLGAYLDHGLKSSVTVQQYQSLLTAVRYHQLYALLILALGFVMQSHLGQKYKKLLNVTSALFIVGLLLFSFGIYISTIFSLPTLMKVVPIGGMTLMGAWLLLAYTGVQIVRTKTD